MENYVAKQEEINQYQVFPYGKALITEVTFKNGAKGEMINLFTKNMDFENIMAGIKRGLLVDTQVASSITKIASIKNGQIDEIFEEYSAIYYTDEERREIYPFSLRSAS